MKVEALRNMLNLIPEEYDDVNVLVAVDDEGNGYMQADGISVNYYAQDPDDWRVESVYTKEELDEEDLKTFKRVLIIT